MANTGLVQGYPKEWSEEVKSLFYEHQNKLSEYIDLLLWWNQKVNLISRSIQREDLLHHIEHSLLSYPLLKEKVRVWDLGTGGGLPGIPLAIINSNSSFLLNDVVNKKIMAVKNICKKMELKNIEFSKGDFKQMLYQQEDAVVTKHAFSLEKFFNMEATNLLDKVIFYKGYPAEKSNVDKITNKINCTIYTLDNLEQSYQGKALYVFNP